MRWIKLRKQSTLNRSPTERLLKLSTTSEKVSSHSDHIEDIDTARTNLPRLQYPFQPLSVQDLDLPHIDKSIVSHMSQQGPSQLEQPSNGSRAWIVINNIVFDCTEFQHEHPGGANVIQSFIGQDCTWQFGRFHSMKHMEDFGQKLRVGRTSGVENRFREPPRYVGLSSLDDDW